jgi:hypothetical protein
LSNVTCTSQALPDGLTPVYGVKYAAFRCEVFALRVVLSHSDSYVPFRCTFAAGCDTSWQLSHATAAAPCASPCPPSCFVPTVPYQL